MWVSIIERFAKHNSHTNKTMRTHINMSLWNNVSLLKHKNHVWINLWNERNEKNMRTMKKSFQMKANHSNEIISQDSSPKTMFDQKRKFSWLNHS